MSEVTVPSGVTDALDAESPSRQVGCAQTKLFFPDAVVRQCVLWLLPQLAGGFPHLATRVRWRLLFCVDADMWKECCFIVPSPEVETYRSLYIQII